MILVIMFIVSIVNMTILDVTNVYIISLILFFFLILIRILVGFEKERSRKTKDALMNTFIFVMIYHILTYILGVFISFYRTAYSLKPLNIMSNLLEFGILIILVELLRYAINKKIDKNKTLLFLSTIVFTMIDIMIISHITSPALANEYITIVSLVVLPSISKNVLLNYLSITVGYSVTIFYKVLTELIIYILPIFPNYNEYFAAILGFVLPIILFVLYYKANKKFEKAERESVKDTHYISAAITLVLIFITLLIVILTSNMFKFYALSIGSGSMSPVINMGDVVIVEKVVEDYSTLKVDDILVFQRDDIVVVHRIVEINETDGHFTYITKGDNNNDVDNWVVSESKVLGKVAFKLKYMGYPTIWLNDLIN